jgi:hypothetical protein
MAESSSSSFSSASYSAVFAPNKTNMVESHTQTHFTNKKLKLYKRNIDNNTPGKEKENKRKRVVRDRT